MFNFLKKKKKPEKTSAQIAYERLKLTIENRAPTLPEDIIDEIKNAITEVIQKYRPLSAQDIDIKDISFSDNEMFEINIHLPPHRHEKP